MYYLYIIIYLHNASIQFEKIQHRFLRYASFTLDVEYPSHDYAPILKVLGLDSLADRRRILSKTFLNDL